MDAWTKRSVCIFVCVFVFTHVPTWNTHKLAMDGYSIKSFVSGLCRGGTGSTVQ